MNTSWIKKLDYYDKIPVGHRKFLTRFNSYTDFVKAYHNMCNDCIFFSVDIPMNSGGKADPLGVIELMVEFAKLELEYS